MISSRNHRITVFEHQSIKVSQPYQGVVFENRHFEALEKFYGSGSDYFTLIHNGVKFNEYVGVLQVGNLMLEILPKADKSTLGNEQQWRAVLLAMLKTVGVFDIKAPSSSSLSLKSNSILDLYFELFIAETDQLLHRGLVKRYRKTEANLNSLKGSIHFSKHVRLNFIHKERFYTRHTIYDNQHLLNLILYKAVKLVLRLNTNTILSSRIGSLMLNFPELPDIRITHEHFKRIVFDRKTEAYRRAIDIARLLLLNYHPDIQSGREDVLAIMFDMNFLWERFVLRSLQRFGQFNTVEAQNTRDFWKPERGQKVRMRPDIVINKNREDCMVLDTKWKLIEGTNPSPDDLRQMFVYTDYYSSGRAALVYPGSSDSITKGAFYNQDGNESIKTCGIVTIHVEQDIRQWQRNIAQNLLTV